MKHSNYKAVFSGNTWKKSLKKIDKQYHLKIKKGIEELCKSDNPTMHTKVEKIKDKNIRASYRYKIGDFRVFFDINNTVLHIYCLYVKKRDSKTYKTK